MTKERGANCPSEGISILHNSTKKKNYLKAISIAGSDSGGGAGLQADLKVFQAHGIYQMTVITAVTAQNTLGVQKVLTLPPEMVRAQLEGILQDMGADLVKIGMLGSAEVVEVVAQVLSQVRYRKIPIILDPVLKSSSGKDLLDERGSELLKKELLPLSYVVTPNLAEAAFLSQSPQLLANPSREEVEKVSKQILHLGSQSVILKGGHLPGKECSDYLLYKNEKGQLKGQWYHQARIETPHTHGTGCAYAAALGAYLLHGKNLQEAACLAQNYVGQALQKGKDWILGKGTGPLNHFLDFPGEFH